jgi:hypothetical protein
MKMRNIIVYGEFKEPEKGVNFIVVRIPDGRCPWAKKIAPAIHRLIKSFTKSRSYPDWNAWGENEGQDLWATKTAVRYLWDGDDLVKQSSDAT